MNLSRVGLFKGLPVEFSPPEKAAQHVADLNTLAEREAYFVRIPAPWQKFIGELVPLMIAQRIVEIPEKARRQDALASVPEIWRKLVKQMVMSLWETREIRAQHQAELAERRARKEEAA